jgi:hypothetical protein
MPLNLLSKNMPKIGKLQPVQKITRTQIYFFAPNRWVEISFQQNRRTLSTKDGMHDEFKALCNL